MSDTNNTGETALAEKVQRCFSTTFGGKILILCLVDGRSTPSEDASGKTKTIVLVDGTKPKPAIKIIPNSTDNATIHSQYLDDTNYCEWRASEQTLTRIFDGGRNLISAFISGRLAISGDMSIMARLNLSDE